MAGLRRNNHYVPKLYLKPWVHDDRIHAYRLLVPQDSYPKWKLHSPTSIAYQKHLYTYWSTHGETDDIEKWLHTDFENPAVEALELAVTENKMRPEHWTNLFRFAMAQHVRTVRAYKEFSDKSSSHTTEDKIKKIVEEAVQEIKVIKKENSKYLKIDDSSVPPAFKTKITESGNNQALIEVKMNTGRALWLNTIKRHLTETIYKVRSHRWTILKPPRGIIWPTSNNPLIRLNYISPGNYNFDGGWDQENCEIFLPISPKHLLYTRVGQKPLPRNSILSEHHAIQIKKFIIENADRYIFSIEPDDIELIRPRIVDMELFQNEQIRWKNWREEQVTAEKEMLKG